MNKKLQIYVHKHSGSAWGRNILSHKLYLLRYGKNPIILGLEFEYFSLSYRALILRRLIQSNNGHMHPSNSLN